MTNAQAALIAAATVARKRSLRPFSHDFWTLFDMYIDALDKRDQEIKP